MTLLPKDKNKRNRLYGLLLYVILANFFVLIFKPDYLYSLLLVLVPPSLVNFLWLKESKYKIFIFSLASTLLFAPPFELLLRLVDAWDVQSTLPRLFNGLVPPENIIFAFFNFFWVLSFYEYFVDKDTKKKISNNFKYLIDIFVFIGSLIIILYYISPELLKTSYVGASIIILIVPAAVIFLHNTSLFKKCALTTLFFAIVFFIYELISLYVGSWWWPGNYYLPVMIFGNVFPIDDIIIWYFMSTPILIGGYEYFMDDDK